MKIEIIRIIYSYEADETLINKPTEMLIYAEAFDYWLIYKIFIGI
jgi:hypothetical protein